MDSNRNKGVLHTSNIVAEKEAKEATEAIEASNKAALQVQLKHFRQQQLLLRMLRMRMLPEATSHHPHHHIIPRVIKVIINVIININVNNVHTVPRQITMKVH